MLDTNLKSKINKLWDRFFSSGLSNPITAIEQIDYSKPTKLLGIKSVSLLSINHK